MKLSTEEKKKSWWKINNSKNSFNPHVAVVEVVVQLTFMFFTIRVWLRRNKQKKIKIKKIERKRETQAFDSYVYTYFIDTYRFVK